MYWSSVISRVYSIHVSHHAHSQPPPIPSRYTNHLRVPPSTTYVSLTLENNSPSFAIPAAKSLPTAAFKASTQDHTGSAPRTGGPIFAAAASQTADNTGAGSCKALVETELCLLAPPRHVSIERREWIPKASRMDHGVTLGLARLLTLAAGVGTPGLTRRRFMTHGAEFRLVLFQRARNTHSHVQRVQEYGRLWTVRRCTAAVVQ